MQTVSKADSKILTIKEVPSKFIPYDISYIQFKALSIGQLKTINSPNLPDAELISIYNDACLNFDILDLSYQDLLFCSAYLALFTDPTQYWSLTITCNSCKHEFSHRIDSRNFLEFHDIEDIKLPLYITVNKQELELSIFTVRDWLEYFKEEYDNHDQDFLTYAFLIKNLKIADSYKAIYDIVDQRDLELLTHIEKKLFHGIKNPMIACPECTKKSEYNVELAVSTLKPFRKSEESFDDRIVFEPRNQS